ncbi:MAP7 domain-containing protein 2-like [Nerophis ophidion]|uniref:MAP7 domain-containing protein 2-like n=1 Tax=Nerophis ophidion TaxID=159077 RepID=UPI002ADFB048|nr:MAP7 domain-containing protein 2-like [Nerophis ophidion]
MEPWEEINSHGDRPNTVRTLLGLEERLINRSIGGTHSAQSPVSGLKASTLKMRNKKKLCSCRKKYALEKERQERRTLAKEQEEREQALVRQRALELERQRALEQALFQQQQEKKEREMEKARLKALEREGEKAVEKERLEREKVWKQKEKKKGSVQQEKIAAESIYR